MEILISGFLTEWRSLLSLDSSAHLGNLVVHLLDHAVAGAYLFTKSIRCVCKFTRDEFNCCSSPPLSALWS